ncbi:hypothetical protein [Vulcanisaeta thermophila]|uniref:hypothetical protein n=1 Tax=Vulcanisaeta thermophila TaxID=867917 RepID=UPI00192E5F9E|nr:hypothetical protein [Vulcanisaeta thermophila]
MVTKTEYYIEKALALIVKARRGMVDYVEALDSLWELLVNIEYEVKRGSRIRRVRH